jgi:hypothetical protein
MVAPASKEPESGAIVSLVTRDHILVVEGVELVLEKIDSLNWDRTDSVGAYWGHSSERKKLHAKTV